MIVLKNLCKVILLPNNTLNNINEHIKIVFSETDGSVKKGSLSALTAITLLKKLCNHPDLVYEKIQENSDGFEGASKLMPENYSTK